VFRRTVSLLVLLTGVSLLHAQAPVKAAPTPAPKEPTLDEKIALALRHHPDIKAGEAKRALAEAELEQTKLALSQKIATASAKVNTAREELNVATELHKIYDKRHNVDGTFSLTELLLSKKNLTIATSNLTLAETELKNLLTMPKAESVKTVSDRKNLEEQQGMYFKFVGKAPAGEMATSLQEFLDLPVVLDLKNTSLTKAFQAIEDIAKNRTVIRFTGFDEIAQLKSIPQFTNMPGKISMQAWFQLFADELNSAKFDVPELNGPYDVYVRDYGILISPIRSAPKDAMTMSEFIRHESEKKQ
jgi:hypothetical protein